MPFRSVFTETFRSCLDELLKQGAAGKRVWTKAHAAMALHASGQRIDFPETHHGELRLPNVTKYDLGDNHYRLVVQSVDSDEHLRAFLFVGRHEDAERWLDNHVNYKWMRRATDNTLEFVLASSRTHHPTRVDRAVAYDDETAHRPLLSPVAEDIATLPFPREFIEYLLEVAASDILRDEDGVFDHLITLGGDAAADAHDLLQHAHRKEWRELQAKIESLRGQAVVLNGEQLADAMIDEANSERIVSFDDLADLPKAIRWDKWLVFLSPKQKAFAKKPLDGPARLSGVSGSGKTCVLLHRARDLANRYNGKILVLTSTESMQTLLGRLLDDLCQGMVRGNIVTKTILGLAREIVCQMLGADAGSLKELDATSHKDVLEAITDELQRYPHFRSSELSRLGREDLAAFLSDELFYLRSRLRSWEYEQYLDAKRFPRRGRGRGLSIDGRGLCIRAAKRWEQILNQAEKWDALSLVQFALELVECDAKGLDMRARDCSSVAEILPHRADHPVIQTAYRSVLVDEVQDLSQLEISLLAALPADRGVSVSQKADGLYLVGDGAQAIYKKGFSLRACGIELPGARSFTLKRNYRNTREVLKAAFEVIKEFRYADFGDDALQSPMLPEFAVEHGLRPMIVACNSIEDEARFVVGQIQGLRQSAMFADGEAHESSRGAAKTGIIVVHPGARDVVASELQSRGMSFGQLNVNRPDTWDAIMLCDVESCKGHEFQVVYVVGVQDGSIPRSDILEDDLPREAARLYVAMTRARDQLVLTYSTTADAGPSPFLWLARAQCDEFRYRDGVAEKNDEEYSDEYAMADRERWTTWLSGLSDRDSSEATARHEPQERAVVEVPTDYAEPLSDRDSSEATARHEPQERAVVEVPTDYAEPSFEIASEDTETNPVEASPTIDERKNWGQGEILGAIARGEISIEDGNRLLSQTAPRGRQLHCKVGIKGGVSVYGLQTRPVTLYVEQWERLLDFADEIRNFASQHESELRRKRP